MESGLLDYHVHIERGPFCFERLERFLEVAQSRGVVELGLSEHGHRFGGYEKIMGHLGTGFGSYGHTAKWLKGKFSLDLEDYVNFVQEAKRRGYPIKLGTEVDYIRGYEEQIGRWIERAPWDYVIGSVHFVDKWGFDLSPHLGWAERDVDDAYVQYFELIKAAAASGLFDIIGHFDVIKLFGHRPSGLSSRSPAGAAMAEAMREIAKADCALDVNTAGWRRPVHELYPAPEILRHAHELGIPITLGSDAHEPEEAGFRLREATHVARAAGYKTVTRFSQRKSEQVTLGAHSAN